MSVPEGWTFRSLSEVVTIQRGFDLPFSQRRPGPFPVLTSGETGGWHDEGPIHGPGVVIGRATNLGQPKWSAGPFWPHNTTMFVADFLGNNPRWVFHLFESVDLSGYDSGSVQPMLNRNYIANVRVVVPPIDVQVAIAEVLGALDDKVANNAAVVRCVSEVAKAQYELAQKSATRLASLAEILTLEYGGALPAGLRRVGDVPVYGSGGVAGFHDTPSVVGPAVIVGRKGSAGSVHWSDRDCFPIDTTFFVRLRPGFESLAYADALLRTLHLRDMNNDSAVPGLNRSAVHALKVLVPDSTTLVGFDVEVSLLYLVRAQLERESARLAELRDTLLPALMSGKLRVRDAEKAVEAAI